MNARNVSALVILASAFYPLSFAQNAPTVSFAGAQEQVIQIEVTPADRVAVAVHRRVHTSGALRPEGGHYPPRTFEADASGALIEVTGNSSSPLSTGQSTTASASSEAPSFAGPGFYPADLSLVSTTGQSITQAQDYCNGYNPPYTSCFSPDKPASWVLCAEHDIDSFTDIPGFEYATVQPYPDVFAVTPYNGVPTPFYPCDVGQPLPLSSDTTPTPNGVVVDSVSSGLSHEIFETITDPDGSEWQAIDGFFGYSAGVEVADVCELHYYVFIFAPFYLSGHLYEIMPEYSNKYHACVTVP